MTVKHIKGENLNIDLPYGIEFSDELKQEFGEYNWKNQLFFIFFKELCLMNEQLSSRLDKIEKNIGIK